MSRIRRTAALSPIALGAVLVLSSQAVTAQPVKSKNIGRVSGLAVTILDQIANGAGKDVEIQVDMTTVRTTFLSPTEERGLGFFGGQFTQDELQTNRSGFGGLGDADLMATSSASDTQGRPFTGLYYNPDANSNRGGAFGDFYSGVALELTFRRSNFTEGELPAIDYGDGSTVDVDTLAPFGTPDVSTSGNQRTIRSRWRGTFTHTYADQGSYTVTAASRCCPLRALNGDDDTATQRGGGPYSVSPGYAVYPNSPSALQFSFLRYSRIAFQSAVQTSGPFDRGTSMTGTFVSTFSNAGTGIRGGGAQVTNTAFIEDGLGSAFAIEVPAAGTYGLALLSLLLAAAGFVTLRR